MTSALLRRATKRPRRRRETFVLLRNGRDDVGRLSYYYETAATTSRDFRTATKRPRRRRETFVLLRNSRDDVGKLSYCYETVEGAFCVGGKPLQKAFFG